MPPIKAVTSAPHSYKMWPRMLDVVVFPCVPATAKQKVSLVIIPKTSARFFTT